MIAKLRTTILLATITALLFFDISDMVIHHKSFTIPLKETIARESAMADIFAGLH